MFLKKTTIKEIILSQENSFAIKKGMLKTFPQCNFSYKFPKILSQTHMLSFTECVRDFQNNTLWDTH